MFQILIRSLYYIYYIIRYHIVFVEYLRLDPWISMKESRVSTWFHGTQLPWIVYCVEIEFGFRKTIRVGKFLPAKQFVLKAPQLVPLMWLSKVLRVHCSLAERNLGHYLSWPGTTGPNRPPFDQPNSILKHKFLPNLKCHYWPAINCEDSVDLSNQSIHYKPFRLVQRSWPLKQVSIGQ